MNFQFSTLRRDDLIASDSTRKLDLTSKESEVSSSSGVDITADNDNHEADDITDNNDNINTTAPLDCRRPNEGIDNNMQETVAKVSRYRII